jgi:hypothetical protein
MTQTPLPKSSLLGPHDPIPEMGLPEFVRLMRAAFDIASERTQERPYFIRLIGPPYNSFVEGCKSIGVMAHDRGTKISPHNIKQVLFKFDITENQFREAYNATDQPPQGTSSPPTARPN